MTATAGLILAMEVEAAATAAPTTTPRFIFPISTRSLLTVRTTLAFLSSVRASAILSPFFGGRGRAPCLSR